MQDELSKLAEKLPKIPKEAIESLLTEIYSNPDNKKKWDALDIDKKVLLIETKTSEDESKYEPPESIKKDVKKETMDNNLKSFIPAVIVSGVLLIFCLVFFVSRNDFTANTQGMMATQDKLKSDITAQINNQNTSIEQKISNAQTNMNNQVNQVQSALSNYAPKSSVDALGGLSGQVTNQLATAKTNQDAAIAAVIKDVNDKLAAQTSNTATAVQSAKDSVSALDTRVTNFINAPKVSGVQLTANVSGGQISLGINSDQNQYVAFRVIFRLVSGNFSNSATSDDFVKSLYATQPVSLSTNIVLVPEYKYNYVGGLWNLTQVVFTTPRTAIEQGYQNKTMSYSFNDATRTYEVMIEPMIDSLVGVGGSNW